MKSQIKRDCPLWAQEKAFKKQSKVKVFGFFLPKSILTYETNYQVKVIKMPLSARNRIKGVVKGIEIGEVAASVKIAISGPATITSMITREAAEELDLKAGDKVEAVIKASEVMVSKE
jgi:molybdate transport system regulatory protein